MFPCHEPLTMRERSGIIVSMNRLSTEKRAQVLSMLVEGNSVRATSRMAGVAINTVQKLILDIGEAAAAYHDEHLRDLPCKAIEADEIWSFVGSKQKNIPADRVGDPNYGDVWTWTALDADSKLIVSWYVGGRGPRWAKAFMEDVASRVASRIQITTDGLKAYAEAVEGAFGMDCDYAMLIKLYGNDSFDTK